LFGIKIQPAGSTRRAFSRGSEIVLANIDALRSNIGPDGPVAAATDEVAGAAPETAVTEIPAVTATVATHMHPAAVATTVTTAATTVTSGSRSKRCEAQGSGGNNCESDFTKHCGSHLCEARHQLCLYADGTQADEIRFNIFF